MAQALVHLTHGKREYLNKVASLNGRVFDTDPVVTYMLLDMSQEERLTYLPTYWSTLVRSALMNDALITEADGWKAASVIIPRGKPSITFGPYCMRVSCVFYGESVSLVSRWRLWSEVSGMTDNAKRKGLHGQKEYYYIFSIGTEHEHRGKGLARQIIQYHQKIARAENLPIWLEATSPSSRHLYLSVGFQEVEEIVLGKGQVNEDATVQSGGVGVPLLGNGVVARVIGMWRLEQVKR
ncbi:hypothetical protein N7450_004314 [Penicillium hetheringtonii]|uniref:N-acetyltransferase domain-containing protein n=1 Tax=Penicillium hetheringtonii TaxID=911720 RepID=A0AAD6GV00_9EURO|nr:hypothetical protein N7450_004314 [Penicillium hetheringtonii]